MKKFILGLFGLAAVSCAIADPETLLAAPKKPPASAPKFSIADQTCSESDGFCRVTITKTGNARSASVVNVRTANGTAISGNDFVAFNQDVSFSKNTSTVDIQIELTSDEIQESTEYLRVNMTALSNANIADNQALVTITDDDDAPAPPTKDCPDGSSVPVEDTCPAVPPPPGPDPEEDDNADIASNFDITTSYRVVTSGPTSSAAPDTSGAFRIICGAGDVGKFDPIVYPGQANTGHLHQFYGNTAITKDSTYSSLRAAGGSTCNWITSTTAANRSAYWMPAMLDGFGNVVKPDHVQLYYKRRPVSDPKCTIGADPQAMGNCVDLPNGLKFIFGYDMLTGTTQPHSLYFNCKGVGAVAGTYASIAAAVGKCVAGGQLGAVIKAPNCWDGENLDSANHRSHMAYASYGTWGYLRCPTTHPYVVPAFTLQAWYTIGAGESISNWSLSSDAMHPELPKGTTFHADFFMAWDPIVVDMWHDNCIDRLLNCSAGNLGNGFKLIGSETPTHLVGGVGVTSWTHPQRLVDDPTQ